MNASDDAHEVHALSGAYAVDALDAEERAEFERHLAACTACQAEVASLRETSALLAGDVETDPPAALRDRVLAGISTVRPLPPETPAPETPAPETTVRRLRPRLRRLPTLLVAAAVLLVAGFGTALWQQGTSDDPTPTVAERVLQAADAKRVDVDLPGGARASVVRSVSVGRAVLVTHDMPEAPSGRVYEVWLQTPAGAMEPAGIMTEAGSTTLVLEGDAAAATAAGITVEPEGGSDAPTTEPIVLFDFEQAV
jgi:anti-sigma-K factor RskA